MLGPLITKQELKNQHFSTEALRDGKRLVLSDIRRSELTLQQDAAHHAFYGARIELLQQGYAPEQTLHGYDIRSAYPSAMLDLPSMRGKTWKHHRNGTSADHARQSNILSMYRVYWRFPATVKYRGVENYAPFYPLPYRTQNGSILFPSEGRAWVMRDDVLAALKWVETFGLNWREYDLVVEEAFEFDPPPVGMSFGPFGEAQDEASTRPETGPFEFVRELYNQRANIKSREKECGYNILELAIKLCINSIYGKFAQRIGGNEFDPPASACPYYAAAITAATRRRICETGLLDPFAIVMFATDGIISTRPLAPLDRPIGEALGDWETKSVTGGMFLQSGVYTFFDGVAHETKMRGARKAFMELPSDPVQPGATMTRHEFLVGETLNAWSRPQPREALATSAGLKAREKLRKAAAVRPFEPPSVAVRQKTFVTVGAALASPASWRIVGRWSELERVANVHDIGVKRQLNRKRPGFYYSVEGAPDNPEEDERGSRLRARALRCSELVPSLPAKNETPELLAKQAAPNWLDNGEDVDANYDEARIFDIERDELDVLADF